MAASVRLSLVRTLKTLNISSVGSSVPQICASARSKLPCPSFLSSHPALYSSPALRPASFSTCAVVHSRKSHDDESKSPKCFSTSTAVQLAEDDDELIENDVVRSIDNQLTSPELGRLFAVIYFDTHQRKVTTEDIIVVRGHLAAEVGETIRLNKVLLVGGKDFTIVGRPVISPDVVQVTATVIEKTLENTRVGFWYRPRQGTKQFRLNKDMFTHLRIRSIELSSLDQK